MFARRTLVIGATLVGGVAFASLFAARALPVLRVGTAYKAKMLCSGVFVAHRPYDVVRAELEVDDLAPLRFIWSSVDSATRSVSASALGIVRRRAVARNTSGCALVFRGQAVAPSQPGSPANPRHPDSIATAPLPEAPLGDPIRLALQPVVMEAFAERESGPAARTQAVVILYRGTIVGERYSAGLDRQTPLLGWSMTKSALNAIVGVLVGQGRLSLDAPVPIAEWQAPGDPRHGITLNQLLRMESGLRFNEGENGVDSDVVQMLLAQDDMASFAAHRDLEATPGARWQYASGNSVLIARAIRSVLGDDDAYAMLPRTALFDRIGMRNAVIETDATGTLVTSSLMYATARDWARLGQLYLDDGVWQGERILPEGWVEYTRMPAPSHPDAAYGSHFWLGVPSGPAAPVQPLPAGTLQAAGHEGQYVTIVPSHGAVIVRMGHTRHGAAWDQAAFVRAVLAHLPERRQGR